MNTSFSVSSFLKRAIWCVVTGVLVFASHQVSAQRPAEPVVTPTPTRTPTPQVEFDRCHLTVGTRGPGNYSLYGSPRDKGQKRKIYVNWISVNMWRGEESVVSTTVRVDPCNRNYGNIWGCKGSEGSNNPRIRYRNGQIYYVTNSHEERPLLRSRINARNQADRSLQDHYGWVGRNWRSFRGSLTEVRSDICTVDDSAEQSSPLVIDLKGEGIKFTDPTRSIVRFDFKRDKLETAWLQNPQGVAFLALDANKNQVIDSVDELFGDRTSLDQDGFIDGFKALQRHDSNQDGVIDAKDPIFSDLLLWQDANRDGKSDPSELSNVIDQITAISLDSDREKYFESATGSFAFGRSAVTLKGGKTRMMYDAWFAEGVSDLFYGELTGKESDLPAKGTAHYAEIAGALEALLEEDGFQPHEAPYSTGKLTDVEMNQVQYKVVRWPIGPQQECTAQLTFDSKWALLDSLVSCTTK